MGNRKYWSKSRCTHIAKKYTNAFEFREKERGCYQAACRNGWLRSYTWMTGFKTPNYTWTYERVLEESKKYKNRTEFIKSNSGAYSAAYRHGWLKDCQWLDTEKVDNRWTLERAMELAKNFKSRTEFAKAYGYAYALCLKYGVCDELFGEKLKTGKKKVSHAE